MKTFVMGDIHGGYKSLIQCLERSGFTKGKDTLIQLGDIADGWKDTYKCIEELLTIPNLISIRGNHDDWLLQWLEFGIEDKMWLYNGGESTISSYKGTTQEDKDRHKAFLKRQHYYYIDDKGRGFVHGGYTSVKGLGKEPNHSNYFWDRGLWNTALQNDKKELPKILKNHTEIFIGHTSTENYLVKPHYKEYLQERQSKNGSITVPMFRSNVCNIDTGGGFGGKLTIMDVDTKEYWQSDKLTDLYK